MKINKRQISNILFVLVFCILFFTPYGFSIKVYINRLLSFSPSEIKIEDQKKLLDYNWNLRTSKGLLYNFNATKGEIVFVNLWATWCSPCVAEMPSIQELYTSYGKDVVFLCVVQDQESKVKDFMEQNSYNFPVYYQDSKSPKKLSSNTIPRTFIIDKEGNISMNKIGSANWNSSEVRGLLDKLVANN